MNHYLGGLICKELEADQPDHEAATEINGVSTAFLDAYLKQDAPARAFLRNSRVSDATNGRAELLSR